MRAESVLIDRIPGKSTVGIQIPNSQRAQISLRDLLESEAYEGTTAKLPIALGKTIHGDPYVADLAAMPHLLIAGSTGTGKSVGINSMLTSILYRATPDDVRLIMVDPKRLELGMYEDIPHLLTPVVVDPKQAANALRWAVREMEERYKTLAGEGVRNLEQYNRNIRQAIAEKRTPRDGGEYPKPLPMIIVLIDELADLMMVAGNEVEQSICRLAQMARAVGIHLILATQRPSVDVITGLIKANMPSRISFRVASKIDSRTILDANGAEQLLGRGDMLFLPPASSRSIRLHGPYISEQESARLASFLRKQGRPNYDETITAEEKSEATGGMDMEKDDLYDEAARIIVTSGQASISYLQRRLRIGFSRAARLVDMMEAEGLVSPSAGGKPREVLVDKCVLRRGGRAAAMTGAACLRTLTVVVAVLSCAASVPIRAQGAPVAVRAAEALFADASAKEVAVRKALAAPSASRTVLKAVRTVVSDYEQVVRQHPSSGFCDDALWRAATLARDAFELFGETRERTVALRLLQLLTSEYPSSTFARQTSAPIAWLTAHPATRNSAAPAATTATAPPSSLPEPAATTAAAAAAPPTASTKLVNVKAIRRAVLKDVVRVVIELDDEIAFHDERLDNPNRVFIDLPSTRANPALIDQTLRFDADTDVVRQIRIGRHPNSITRVVLETAGVSSYSVYPLYSPYRLVIDCLREKPVASLAAVEPSLAPRPVLPAPRALPVVPVVLPPASPLRQATIAPLTPVVAMSLDLLDAPPSLESRRIAPLSALAAGSLSAAPAGPTLREPVPAVTPAPVAAAKPLAPAPTAPPARNVAGGLSLARQLGLGVSRIVIDPGHGGHDPGAKGGGVTEAELVLDVALRLEKLLTKLPGVDVVLTRRDNTFIPLQETDGDRQPRECRPVSLDPRQRQPAAGGSWHRNLLPELRLDPERRRGRGARECDVGADHGRAAGRGEGDCAEQQTGRVARLRHLRPARDDGFAEVGEQDAEGPGREAGAVRGADWRLDAERARGDLVPHQPAGSQAAKGVELPPEGGAGALRRRARVPELAEARAGRRAAAELISA